ncbi:hypothetical protein Angca_006873, partial [Angiostrongylus cantonensis]
VCPFSGEPLMYDNEFAYCRPSIIADCPVGYLCDQSFVLGRSICCHDKRLKPQPNRPPVVQVSSIRSPLTWNRITPTAPPKWNVRTTVKKAPWYIKNGYEGVRGAVVGDALQHTSGIDPRADSSPSLPSRRGGQIGTKFVWENSSIDPIHCTRSKQDKIKTSEKPSASPRGTISPKLFTITQRYRMRSRKDDARRIPFHNVKITWAGHVMRMNNNRWTRAVSDWIPRDVKRTAGRPLTRCVQIHFSGLSKEGLTVDQINTVVITHGHPGHMGNMNFFGQKPIIFNSMEYIGRHITPTALTERPYRKLSSHIEVWKTPGHTQQDLSILVHDVPNYGTMAVVGDLIPSEALLSEKRDILDQENIWDSAIKRQNANLIICMADWIIPGHGQPFRVLPGYRQRAGCSQLLAQRH